MAVFRLSSRCSMNRSRVILCGIAQRAHKGLPGNGGAQQRAQAANEQRDLNALEKSLINMWPDPVNHVDQSKTQHGNDGEQNSKLRAGIESIRLLSFETGFDFQ